MNDRFNSWISAKKNQKVENDTIKHADLKRFLNDCNALLFPGYVDNVSNLESYIDQKVNDIKIDLTVLLKCINDIQALNEYCNDYECAVESFLNKLPELEELIETDIQALFDGDPAAKSKKEIIICYPGLKAIVTYRLAHILYDMNIPILPRALSEYAHSKTGIDIHPGAKIGPYFFIDHGTGIVIGETTEIGEHVKIYQGVTLGALSLSKGHDLFGSKRHPTIMDNVTIYSGASIFGGETIIGKNCTIGSSSYIVSSVEEDTIVTIKGQIKKHK
jgi:serine O-acetyltransferase